MILTRFELWTDTKPATCLENMNDYSFTGPPLARPDSLIPTVPVTAGARALRPFGYLLIGLVWLAIFGVSIFLWAVLPASLAASGPLHLAPGITKLAGDGGEIAAAIIAMLIAAVLFGFVLFFVPVASGSLTLLSFI